jgi:hypothetical protein
MSIILLSLPALSIITFPNKVYHLVLGRPQWHSTLSLWPADLSQSYSIELPCILSLTNPLLTCYYGLNISVPPKFMLNFILNAILI